MMSSWQVEVSRSAADWARRWSCMRGSRSSGGGVEGAMGGVWWGWVAGVGGGGWGGGGVRGRGGGGGVAGASRGEVGVREFRRAGEGERVGEDGEELAEFEGAQVPFEVGADRVGEGHRVSFRAGVVSSWPGRGAAVAGRRRAPLPLLPAAAGAGSPGGGCWGAPLAGGAGALGMRSCSTLPLLFFPS